MWIAVLSIAVLVPLSFVRGVQAQNLIEQNLIENEVLSFDIPPQPLETALEAFGEQSRLQALYETALTSERRSGGVKGTFTRSAALRQLLAGTGLDFNITGERAFTVVPTQTAVAPSLAVASYNQFLGGVQANVLSVLCRNSETRPGAFRLAIQFWIGDSGRIENPRLLSSTGADRRDAAITAALRSVAFGRSPPSNMPQPVTMVLRPGPTDARDECAGSRP